LGATVIAAFSCPVRAPGYPSATHISSTALPSHGSGIRHPVPNFPIPLPPGKSPDADPPAGPGIRPRRGSSGAHAGKSALSVRMTPTGGILPRERWSAHGSQVGHRTQLTCMSWPPCSVAWQRELRPRARDGQLPRWQRPREWECVTCFYFAKTYDASSPPWNPGIGVAAGKWRGSPRPRWPRRRPRAQGALRFIRTAHRKCSRCTRVVDFRLDPVRHEDEVVREELELARLRVRLVYNAEYEALRVAPGFGLVRTELDRRM
jgi:hypothetical protein